MLDQFQSSDHMFNHTHINVISSYVDQVYVAAAPNQVIKEYDYKQIQNET